MKFSEIQNKDVAELQEMLKNARVRLGKFRFELANKSLNDSSQIRKVKKEIARVLTAVKSQKVNRG